MTVISRRGWGSRGVWLCPTLRRSDVVALALRSWWGWESTR